MPADVRFLKSPVSFSLLWIRSLKTNHLGTTSTLCRNRQQASMPGWETTKKSWRALLDAVRQAANELARR